MTCYKFVSLGIVRFLHAIGCLKGHSCIDCLLLIPHTGTNLGENNKIVSLCFAVAYCSMHNFKLSNRLLLV